jgi:hypothetical protein
VNVTFLTLAEAPKLPKVRRVRLNNVDYPILYLQQKYTEHAKELFVASCGIEAWEEAHWAALRHMVVHEIEQVTKKKQKDNPLLLAELPLKKLCAYVIVNPLPPAIMVDFDPALRTERLTIIPWVDGVEFPKAGEKLPRQVWLMDHGVFTSMDEGAWPNTGELTVPVGVPDGVPNKNGDVIPLGVFDHSKYGTGPSDDWMNHPKTGHTHAEPTFQEAHLPQLEQVHKPEDLSSTMPDIAYFEQKLLNALKIPKDLIKGPDDVKKHYGEPLPVKVSKKWRQVQKALNFALMYGVSGPAFKKLVDQKVAEAASVSAMPVDAFTGAPHHTCFFTGAPHSTETTETKEQELRENLARYGFKIAGKL